jgi:dTDP-4-amino-4,6-dideoxygalactose transaminase
MRSQFRDKVIEKLKEAGIMSSQVHIRNDKHTAMKEFLDNDLPGVDEFTREQFSIPVGWWLTEEEIKHIIATLKEIDDSL